MLVRRYQGRNEDEAIAKAKADLGPDAVILHVKQLSKDGIFNLKSAAKVEVIVGLDQDFDEDNREVARPSPSPRKSKSSTPNDVLTPQEATVSEVSQPHREGFGEVISGQKEPRDHGFRAYVLSSYSNFKETLEPKGPSSSRRGEREAYRNPLNPSISNLSSTSPVLNHAQRAGEREGSAAQKLYQHLRSHEVLEDVAQQLSLSIQELISDESSLCLEEAVNICVEELIRTSGGLNISQRPAVIAFVGPTGVGKTTTIAKLAAHYHLKKDQKISLITVDTYRIAAVEQLKTYATYIGVPLEIALTPQEMHQLVGKYKNCDLILIDTPGRSQKDSMRIQELSMILSAAQPTEVHLLLNVTTQHRTLCDIVRGFSVLSPNRLLFTKLDESASFGNILNFSVTIGKPISYLTTGQDVPDDIELATTERITEYLLREGDVHLL